MTKKIGVIGLGVTGFSVVEYLRSQNFSVFVMDSRQNPPKFKELIQHFPEVEYRLGDFTLEPLLQAEKIIVSPGISLEHPVLMQARKHGIPLLGDMQLFAERVKVPVVGITGTNAKSTVTTLVGLMAQQAGKKAAVGGNLGTPVLDLLRTMPDADCFILELSSFQLEAVENFPLEVACILNITPDHLDRYASFDEYCNAKKRIYVQASQIVANLEDQNTWPQSHHSNIKKINYFTSNLPQQNEFGIAMIEGKKYLMQGRNKLIAVEELPLIGWHDQINALAALAIGDCMNFPFESMLHTLRHFKGLSHRCQFVRELNGVRWYNDSKGTNVGATQAAIAGLGCVIPGKLILILGGLGKQADFKPLIPFLTKYASHAVLIGESANEIASTIEGTVKYERALSLEEAVDKANILAKPGDAVLLSPACASWDMFIDYAHRGNVFTDYVNQLSMPSVMGNVK